MPRPDGGGRTRSPDTYSSTTPAVKPVRSATDNIPGAWASIHGPTPHISARSQSSQARIAHSTNALESSIKPVTTSSFCPVCLPPLSAKARPQVADTGRDHEETHETADDRVGKAGLDPGTQVGACEPADAGRPVGGDRTAVINRQDRDGHHACDRGYEGGAECCRRDLCWRPSCPDQNGGQY